MKTHPATPVRARRRNAVLTVALIAIVVFAGWRIQAYFSPPSPAVGEAWRTVLANARALEKQIGFTPSPNFARLATDLAAYPFCGRASNRRLAYSYQDRLIEWPEIEDEAQCRAVGPDTDVYFDTVEAWGEIGTPVTAAMVEGKLDRFVYLIIHEDCHDQYNLPYGIEEPLCDVITHRAMTRFARENYRWHDVESRAIKHYARTEPEQSHRTIEVYRNLERIYERFERGEITHQQLLQLREREFEAAGKALGIPGEQLNNIAFANYMTYSRHYPALARIADAWGDDLAGLVAFFRLVDERKPSQAAVLQRLGLEDERDPAFLRVYEEEVLKTAHKLAGETSKR